MKSKKQRYIILFCYVFFISFLFCLPGSAFPKAGWLHKIWFDKWVHIGLFLILAYLFCWALRLSSKRGFAYVFLLAALYGIGVETVQDQFIANRSFDMGDWIADMIGAIAGVWLWNWRQVNKKH